MSEPRVLRHDEGGLATLTLNRPDKLNALDMQIFEELDAHAAAIAGDAAIGCVVLKGAGRAFCAGADLGGIAGAGQFDPRYKPGVIEALSALPQPVIAAVHGTCYTGGLELALACDFILAEPNARFADTHGKWGLVGAWGMTQRLPRRIGLPAAKRMMLTSRTVGAAEALAMGLIDQLAEEGGLDTLVAALAGEVLANSWHTNRWTKRLIRETDGMSLGEGLAHENYRYPGLAPDYKERIGRFTKK